MQGKSYAIKDLFSSLRRPRSVLIFLLLLIQTACTTLSSPIATSWPIHEKALKNLNQWTAEGSMSITTPAQHVQTHFHWVTCGPNYTINWFGPLGTYHYELVGTPNFVQLTTAYGRVYRAKNPESLLKNTANMDLPVSNLKYWIKGLPVPGPYFNAKLDNRGNLTSFTQQSWTIELSDYTRLYSTNLPTKIKINGEPCPLGTHPSNIKFSIQWG